METQIMAGAIKEEKVTIEAQSPYGVKRELFEEATKIKNQLELLQKRLEKMDEHRTKVSDAVYLKVKTDYELQIDEVRRNFKEKSREIEKELAKLSQARAEQETELAKHEEILEEAKFRHTLGEYTEKKFKEVEREENKAIGSYQGVLEIIKNSISQYEDILGRAYTPQIIEEPEEEMAEERVNIEVAKIMEEEGEPEVSEFTPPTVAKSAKASPPFSSPVSVPVREDSVTDALVSKGSANEAQLEAELDEELDSLLQTEGDYFSESALNREEGVPGAAEASPLADTTEKVPVIGKGPKSVSKTQPDDDSISSILKDIPLEEEAGPAEEGTDTGEATGAQRAAGEFPEASFLLLEGDLDEPEIILSENTTIGRSPSNDIVLKESKVSRQHATVHFRDGRFVIVDLKSSNGVLVNNKRVEEHYLQDGDEVRIGSFKFQFNIL
jgi:FHA domain-containing protein